MSSSDYFTATLSLPGDVDLALFYALLTQFAEHQRLGVAVMPCGLDFHLRPVAELTAAHPNVIPLSHAAAARRGSFPGDPHAA